MSAILELQEKTFVSVANENSSNRYRLRVEEYREPSADGYRFKKTYAEDETFNPVAFPEVEIKVSDLMIPKIEDE